MARQARSDADAVGDGADRRVNITMYNYVRALEAQSIIIRNTCKIAILAVPGSADKMSFGSNKKLAG